MFSSEIYSRSKGKRKIEDLRNQRKKEGLTVLIEEAVTQLHQKQKKTPKHKGHEQKQNHKLIKSSV
jgi:hypothetical protein